MVLRSSFSIRELGWKLVFVNVSVSCIMVKNYYLFAFSYILSIVGQIEIEIQLCIKRLLTFFLKHGQIESSMSCVRLLTKIVFSNDNQSQSILNGS